MTVLINLLCLLCFCNFAMLYCFFVVLFYSNILLLYVYIVVRICVVLMLQLGISRLLEGKLKIKSTGSQHYAWSCHLSYFALEAGIY